jgi:undecaprenyl diphosphate synthase
MLRDGLRPEDLDERTFSSYLYTEGMRDPDLIIRTAGEMRLSNFLIWQAAYAEYWSTPLYWPDFGKADLERAVREYGSRERRFGSLTAVRGGLRDSD